MKKTLIGLCIAILAVSVAFAMGGKPPQPEERVEYVEETQTVPQEEAAAEEVAPESTEEDSSQYDSETLEEIPQSEETEIY